MSLPVHAREWMEQWASARIALERVRRRELRGLSSERALAASEALLSLISCPPSNPSRWARSGLVEQQALFHRRRS